MSGVLLQINGCLPTGLTTLVITIYCRALYNRNTLYNIVLEHVLCVVLRWCVPSFISEVCFENYEWDVSLPHRIEPRIVLNFILHCSLQQVTFCLPAVITNRYLGNWIKINKHLCIEKSHTTFGITLFAADIKINILWNKNLWTFRQSIIQSSTYYITEQSHLQIIITISNHNSNSSRYR